MREKKERERITLSVTSPHKCHKRLGRLVGNMLLATCVQASCGHPLFKEELFNFSDFALLFVHLGGPYSTFWMSSFQFLVKNLVGSKNYERENGIYKKN